MVRTIDVMPTIMDYLKIEPDSNKLEMQGKTLKSLISGNIFNKFLGRSLPKYAFSETGGLYGMWPSPDKPNVKCIRNENWKLIHNLSVDTWELYNLKKDPNELNNLILEENKVVSKLKSELFKIIEETQC